MVEEVARRHTYVVRVGRCQVLKVTADFVDEPKAELRVGGAAADDDLVAPVGQADPVGLLESLTECAARNDHAVGFGEVGEHRRVPDRI